MNPFARRPLLLIAVSVLAGGLVSGRAPVPARNKPDLPKLARESRDDRRHLAERLIAVAGDASVPEEDRWRAVVALADLDDRVAIDYLVEHIRLRLRPPLQFRSEDRGEGEVCYFVLTTRRPGRGAEDDDWNCAQAVLRAVGKHRTDSELVAYARVLELALGAARYSDGMVSKRSRALALVEAELAAEQVPTRVPGCADEDRRDRLKNLAELRRLLGGAG
jgi:hypothetical protein